jgi:hypothetical protein
MEWETTKTQPNNPGADGEQSSHRSGKTNAPAERLELQIGELSNGAKRPAASARTHFGFIAASHNGVCEVITRLVRTLAVALRVSETMKFVRSRSCSKAFIDKTNKARPLYR